MVLTQLGAAMAGIIDSIMVGHYGTTELAAVSFANSIFFTLIVFAIGCLMGITPIVGYAYVQQKHDEVRQLLRAGLSFCLWLSVAMILLLLAFLRIIPHMGQDPAMVEVCIPYFVLATVSTLPLLLAMLFKQFLEGLGNTIAAMIIAISMNVLNIPLNWMFIFGHLGLPAMGATGAGIATLIVRSLQPILLFAVIYYMPAWRTYLTRARAIYKEVYRIAKIGLPIGLQQCMEIVAFTFSFTFVGWISKEAVAAHQIANHLSDLFFMVSMGIGSAAVIRVSHQYGAGKIHDMHMAARAALHMGLLWAVIAVAVCVLGQRAIPRLFTEDESVIAIAMPLFVLCGLFQISDAMQCIGGAMLRGLADVRWPMCFAFVTYILITLPLGYILMFPCGLGVRGMWYAFIVGLTLAAILMLSRWHMIAPKEDNTITI